LQLIRQLLRDLGLGGGRLASWKVCRPTVNNPIMEISVKLATPSATTTSIKLKARVGDVFATILIKLRGDFIGNGQEVVNAFLGIIVPQLERRYHLQYSAQ
jgi:hypothetical protein